MYKFFDKQISHIVEINLHIKRLTTLITMCLISSLMEVRALYVIMQPTTPSIMTWVKPGWHLLVFVQVVILLKDKE